MALSLHSRGTLVTLSWHSRVWDWRPYPHCDHVSLPRAQCKGLPNVEALADKLEDTDPRYILYIHKVAHSDGRVQYPIAFIVYLPDQMPVHLKVMYTRPSEWATLWM